MTAARGESPSDTPIRACWKAQAMRGTGSRTHAPHCPSSRQAASNSDLPHYSFHSKHYASNAVPYSANAIASSKQSTLFGLPMLWIPLPQSDP